MNSIFSHNDLYKEHNLVTTFVSRELQWTYVRTIGNLISNDDLERTMDYGVI